MHNDENTVAIVARLFLRGKTFMNWPIPTFQGGNNHELLRQFEGKIKLSQTAIESDSSNM